MDNKGVWALNYYSDGRDRSRAVFGSSNGQSFIESFHENEDGKRKIVTYCCVAEGTQNINSVEDIYFNEDIVGNKIIENMEYWGTDLSMNATLDELDGDMSLYELTNIVKYGLKIITWEHNKRIPQAFKLDNGWYVYTNSIIYYDEYTAEGDYGWISGVWIVFENKGGNYYIKFIGNSQ